MLTHEQNELLTRVEGDAPMGRLMREHYWIPALLSAQLEADGAPQRVRLLGSDHVAFRASDGRVGFFAEACPHRGCSLVLARNEDCGLRCIFHGWKIDVGGFVSDVPTHAAESRGLRGQGAGRAPPGARGRRHRVGVARRDARSPFPELPFTALDDRQVWMTITKAYCNWLQGVEATLDSAHVGTLHEAYITAWADTGDKPLANTLEALAPRYDVEHTDLRPRRDRAPSAARRQHLPPHHHVDRAVRQHRPRFGRAARRVHRVTHRRHPPQPLLRVVQRRGDPRRGPPTRVHGHDHRRPALRPVQPRWLHRLARRQLRAGPRRDASAATSAASPATSCRRTWSPRRAWARSSTGRRSTSPTADVAVIQARRLLLQALDDMEAGRPVVGSGPDLDHRNVVPVDEILPAHT